MSNYLSDKGIIYLTNKGCLKGRHYFITVYANNDIKIKWCKYCGCYLEDKINTEFCKIVKPEIVFTEIQGK